MANTGFLIIKKLDSRFRLLIMAFIVFSAISCSTNKAVEQEKQNTKLVLQITVDGMRADMLYRYQERFVNGGFNYLLKNGVVYKNAFYQHANTETVVGHATLATGAFPSVHGMVGNVWFDDESGEIGYNIEDPNAPILPSRENIVEGAQVDPAQKVSRSKGRSPRAMETSTIGDEIMKSSAGKAKVYGVSGKDRASVTMAGHTGKAFWYSTDNGDFVTSKYYYDQYPDWVNEWNGKRQAQNLAGTSWELINDLSTYKLKDQDDRAYETDLKGYGRVFPHPYGNADDKLLASKVLVSPKGDALTFDFAKALVVNEEIGKDEVADYLSISFSAVDAVNHFFGPSSLENEDVVLQLDRILVQLFDFIDAQVGLENTLIVLAADHGMAEMPEYMTELGYEVGRLYSQDIVARVNEIGLSKFEIDGIAKSFFRPSLYLDEAKIEKAGYTTTMVEKIIAAELTKMDGIALAVPRSGLDDLEKQPVYYQIKNNFHSTRSGDIYVAQEPYWFLFEKGPVAVMHGSPWKYDTHVPIMFVGSGIMAGVQIREVHPVDIAPSIATFIGITPSAACTGKALIEIQ